MKTLSQHLTRLQGYKRRPHHPLQHKIHREFKISKGTLFYIKEYGPHTHIAKTIIKESIKILFLASLISSFGGLALEHIKTIFIAIIPLTILLPTLNDMVGDYGTVISSRFSTLLHEGKVRVNRLRDANLKQMVFQIYIVAFLTGTLSAVLALVISHFTSGYTDFMVAQKIMVLTIVDILILITLIIIIAIASGVYYFKKGEDPNNFLIPITTSVADFANMIILALLVRLIF